MTKFNPRYTAPSANNPYYLANRAGGYNPCILINGNSVLPNCVGYANGRSRELSDNQCEMPACNAVDWWNNTNYEKGTAPRLGAVICWSGSYGHVGVVEAINNDGTITVSQSNYGGTRFFLTKLPISNLNIANHPFMGFIYNPFVEVSNAIDPVNYGVFRLYNPYSGEHLPTADIVEVNRLIAFGWQNDGVSFYHDQDDGVPCHRLINPGGDHMLTKSDQERDYLISLGYSNEGDCFNVATSGDRPVYRLFNPFAKTGTHLWTQSTKEINDLIQIGWKFECVAWYDSEKR